MKTMEHRNAIGISIASVRPCRNTYAPATAPSRNEPKMLASSTSRSTVGWRCETRSSRTPASPSTSTTPTHVVGPLMCDATHPVDSSETTFVYPPIHERLIASLDFWWNEYARAESMPYYYRRFGCPWYARIVCAYPAH